jgi:hypothetical protein
MQYWGGVELKKQCPGGRLFGFAPMPLNNLAKAQADCIVKLLSWLLHTSDCFINSNYIDKTH